ncbi:DUF72 domain-containing protein [Candidatus Caldatribacterium sp.]|uniref:DUF72 domain-containing protein n=1 Tax=Candidatus Caldatribacterium sp. TaxID=2282143 RepID=UPI00299B8657|nr:DUF72 domain-containing protein [Candidatus Caldatribacterium sp.]MDW8081511.1 DUF72 domain-containing protein [Candidatus Calescibacterium sp.]
MIHVGVCGFPRKHAEIFASFDVVEVQQTFYALVPVETLIRLRDKAPERFLFTLKAFQGITHLVTSPTYRRTKLPPSFRLENLGFFRKTEEVAACAHHTLLMAEALRARVLVFQCPPSFTPTPEHVRNLVSFFEHFPRGICELAWEPRGRWKREDVLAICRDLNLVHVVDPFREDPVWGAIAYFRLHGRGSYRYQYTDEDLQFLAQKLQAYDREVFCLFNNIPMFEDAKRFKEKLALSCGGPCEGFLKGPQE